MFEITAERLREVLEYNAATGIFRWRLSTSNRKPVGSVAGCKHKVDGRIYISIDGRLYKAHRLAWLYMHGAWPPHGIDHRDGVPDHNWIDNLRPATQAQNSQNIRRPHSDNSTGFLGVTKLGDGTFIASVQAGIIRAFSKKYPTAAEAHAAYLDIKAALHPFATIRSCA